MDSIEFLVVIAVLASILVWYIHNVRSGSDGHAGLFALRREPSEKDPAHTPKPYRAALHAEERTADNRNEATPNRSGEIQPRQKYRGQTKARYRVKDKAARYRPQ